MKYIFTIIIFLIHHFAYTQMSEYTHTRELQGISEQWHKITLPANMYAQLTPRLNDIRIFGITLNGDTIEAPYLRQELTETILNDKINFEIINKSHNDKGYYYTFKLPAAQSINRIELNFGQQNFDWQITLEGSQNQSEWFTILDQYRIISLNIQGIDYQYTTLKFSDAKYRYFRLFIPVEKQANEEKSDEKETDLEEPDLKQVSISLRKIIEGKYKNYPAQKIDIINDKKTKQSIIDIDMGQSVPVSYLNIDIKNDYDYYRPMTIKYLRDSFKTDKDWQYNYVSLASGTLNSLEKNELKFTSKRLQKLQIIIRNQDNEPLDIGEISIKGYVNELTARFTEPATYYLTYGNPKARKAQYDISRFKDKIPESLTELELGVVQKINKKLIPSSPALFENKAWLWAVMFLIISTLGWFTIQMIRNK